jgi:hypothetical protein
MARGISVKFAAFEAFAANAIGVICRSNRTVGCRPWRLAQRCLADAAARRGPSASIQPEGFFTATQTAKKVQ